jgi:hypothetical protein
MILETKTGLDVCIMFNKWAQRELFNLKTEDFVTVMKYKVDTAK